MRTVKIIFTLLLFFCTTLKVYASEEVRVAIMQDVASLNIKISGSYEVTDAKGKLLSRGRNLKATIIVYKGSIILAGIVGNLSEVLINPLGEGPAVINGRNFRGAIQLIKTGDAKLTVINRIGLEDYVKGILYHEASHYWPMESLKAQAIVSRTYAVYQMQANRSKDFDVTSDIYSQVYGGKTSERERTNRAVNETRGQILTYQGKVIPTYFHATCGGYTEDASVLWNINIPPLKGVACGFCKDSPHFNWHYVALLDEISEKLADAGHKTGSIKNIIILGRNNSGRVFDLKISGSKKDLKISAKDFRSIMSPNIIRSTNFSVSVVNKDAVFEGLGWGHGVGLCQWGAYFMAKQGHSAGQILKYYYPGAYVKTK